MSGIILLMGLLASVSPTEIPAAPPVVIYDAPIMPDETDKSDGMTWYFDENGDFQNESMPQPKIFFEIPDNHTGE
jgi:hypothetical protein